MKKKSLFSLGFVFALPLFASESNAETINYYVIAKQAEPFQIENGNKHKGIVTDIVNAVFEQSQYNIQYHTYPFNRMIALLEAGDETNWITYGSPHWGGVQAENLSNSPIYNVQHVLVSSNASPFNFNTMQDLKDKVVVLLHGFDYPELIPYIKEGTIDELRVKDYSAAFRVINKIPGDTAFVEMASRIKYNLKKEDQDKNKYILQPFSTVIPDYPIYLAFDPKMDPELQAFINERLDTLKSTGKIDTIIETYF
ncbi:transporter substrate-binding domain-containing protein [Photobacterium sp. ZSDE20]|uniref:Transporter substrate-binding domain-containing protein n=1 Tax=Photobacterium pectinilyticum TaxID=2906793 RepID=A0ABT1N4S5_9GAMM|nr:transporter substrate-binding domain-containing protein [Photobacterium sp. ZSDE20]MCQ1059751.1 transporter substrate-binding domain-containing protein [Photobacterium sp. ZSDE20]MDD1825986.1 transporter substrate-binding domain-containing protein [Photobacterium sp. ZSDE20]